MRGLNRSVTHGVTRNKAVTRGDSATQELLGVLLRRSLLRRGIHKSMLGKHGGSNINQRRRRDKLLEPRRRLGNECRVSIQIAQALANNHVVNMELRV